MVIPHTSKEFLSKLTYFFLKYGDTLSVKVTGKRRFSYDLAKGGMEIPAEYVFKTENKDLYDQMKEKTLEEVEKFEDRRKIGLENSLKKKEKKN